MQFWMNYFAKVYFFYDIGAYFFDILIKMQISGTNGEFSMTKKNDPYGSLRVFNIGK